MALMGCNRFHTPITIDPKGELLRSKEFVRVGKTTFHVPGDWTLNDVLRDPSPGGASIALRQFRGGKVAGNMSAIAQTSKPDWLAEPDVRTTSTARHQKVLYRLEPQVAPSGDDTPRSYCLVAWIESPETSWELFVGLLHPVEGGVDPAVGYADALEFIP